MVDSICAIFSLISAISESISARSFLCSAVILPLLSFGESLFIIILAAADATAPPTAMAVPRFFVSFASAFCLAHSSASLPVSSVNARDRDVYAPLCRPSPTLSYRPVSAASIITSDSMPGCLPRASLRIFKSAARALYSFTSANKSFPPGRSMLVSPPFIFRPRP